MHFIEIAFEKLAGRHSIVRCNMGSIIVNAVMVTSIRKFTA